MSTTTTKAVIIVIAWLPITLIFKAMNMAASLTSVKRDVVRIMRFFEANLFKRILMFTEINFMFFVQSIINFWSKSPWAETTLDDSMACGTSISHCCRATPTCTIRIVLTWHALTLFSFTIRRARCLFTCAFLCNGLFSFRHYWFWFFLDWLLFFMLWCNSVAAWFYVLFAIFMSSFVSFSINWLGSRLALESLLFSSFSFSCSLFLSSYSFMLTCGLIGNFQSFVFRVWYSRL